MPAVYSPYKHQEYTDKNAPLSNFIFGNRLAWGFPARPYIMPYLTGLLNTEFILFKTLGDVVLPEHMYWVRTFPLDDSDFSTRWRRIKMEFAWQQPLQERLSAVRAAKGERGI